MVLITGNFNLDFSDGVNCGYKESIASLGYHQFVNSPTHYNIPNNSSSIIDHFYSNQLQNSISVKILSSDVSDHLPVLAWIKTPHIKKKAREKISHRDMKLFDTESFLNDLSTELNHIVITDDDDPNQVFEKFLISFNRVIDIHAPFRQLTRREIHQ